MPKPVRGERVKKNSKKMAMAGGAGKTKESAKKVKPKSNPMDKKPKTTAAKKAKPKGKKMAGAMGGYGSKKKG